MIFILRKLQEKSAKQRQPFIVAFVDFIKVFDIVYRETLWKILSLYGCLKTFIRVIQSFHDGMAARIFCGDRYLDPFSIRHGVKQGCVLEPIFPKTHARGFWWFLHPYQNWWGPFQPKTPESKEQDHTLFLRRSFSQHTLAIRLAVSNEVQSCPCLFI